MTIVNSYVELVEWMSQALDKHRQTGERSCSCGWEDEQPRGNWELIPWQQHFDAVIPSDLGDALASDTSNATGHGLEHLAWRPEAVSLYETIDGLHEEVIECRDVLWDIAVGDLSGTEARIAAAKAALTTFAPETNSAAELRQLIADLGA